MFAASFGPTANPGIWMPSRSVLSSIIGSVLSFGSLKKNWFSSIFASLCLFFMLLPKHNVTLSNAFLSLIKITV